MNQMLNQIKKLIVILLFWVSLLVFMLITHPESLPLPLLIMPFALLAIALYKTARTVLRVSFRQISDQKVKTMAGVIAVLPTLLLILASIRQLTVRDVAIVFGLLLLLVFYMRRIDFVNF